jgi:hypothetical protein
MTVVLADGNHTGTTVRGLCTLGGQAVVLYGSNLGSTKCLDEVRPSCDTFTLRVPVRVPNCSVAVDGSAAVCITPAHVGRAVGSVVIGGQVSVGTVLATWTQAPVAVLAACCCLWL